MSNRKLSGLTLLVPTYDAGIGFFVNKLGFDLLENTDMGGGKRWVVVRPPHSRTGLLLAQADGEEQARAIGDQFAGRVGLFLRVDAAKNKRSIIA